jgi:hypothetical protein
MPILSRELLDKAGKVREKSISAKLESRDFSIYFSQVGLRSARAPCESLLYICYRTRSRIRRKTKPLLLTLRERSLLLFSLHLPKLSHSLSPPTSFKYLKMQIKIKVSLSLSLDVAPELFIIIPPNSLELTLLPPRAPLDRLSPERR